MGNKAKKKKNTSCGKKRKKSNIKYTSLKSEQFKTQLCIRIIFLSHSHQKKYLLHNPSPYELLRIVELVLKRPKIGVTLNCCIRVSRYYYNLQDTPILRPEVDLNRTIFKRFKKRRQTIIFDRCTVAACCITVQSNPLNRQHFYQITSGRKTQGNRIGTIFFFYRKQRLLCLYG